MKRFNFPLDRVRRWRLEQLNVEELKLQQLRAELEALAATKRVIQAELTHTQQQILGQAYLQSSELESLDSYGLHIRGRVRELEHREWERGIKAMEQRTKVIEARRQFELLEQLRKKSLGAWKTAADKEQEELAAELYLARRGAANPGRSRLSTSMPLSFPKVGIPHDLWGGPPGPRGTPSSRSLEQENQHLAKREQADGGVGRGPGGPPHN